MRYRQGKAVFYMENVNEKISNYLNTHRDEIANSLMELVKIPSISDTEWAKVALDLTCNMYQEGGFSANNYGTYALAQYKRGERTIGLFSHADVVPVQNDWTMCNPFEPKIIDGNIFGRGSWDDKSAVIISLYTFKMIKELDLDFNSTLIAFIGGNEETTMQDIVDYKKSNTLPDISMVLDAGYPVYLGDKGILWLECEKRAELEDIVSIVGGEAVNITLKTANAKVKYSQNLYSELSLNDSISVNRDTEYIYISATGVSAHGANPENTVNGCAIILNALFACPSFSKNDKKQLSFLLSVLNAYEGEELCIRSQDTLFGKTTATNGIINIDKDLVKFTLDVRYGSTFTSKNLIEKLSDVLSRDNISFKVVKNGEPTAISKDNKFVLACIEAYREHTGNYEKEPKINAGSTYSRHLTNAFETGTTTRYDHCNLPSGHGFAHQPDEHISIDGLLDAIAITLKMVLKIDKTK